MSLPKDIWGTRAKPAPTSLCIISAWTVTFFYQIVVHQMQVSLSGKLEIHKY